MYYRLYYNFLFWKDKGMKIKPVQRILKPYTKFWNNEA